MTDRRCCEGSINPGSGPDCGPWCVDANFDPLAPRPEPASVLAIECSNRCGRPARARGMCAVCYEFDRRNRLGRRTFSFELLKAKQRIVDLEVENTRLREALQALKPTPAGGARQ